ncbi:MAG: hypothetical protein REI09_09415 [Candidatus Dactylopiibacterium sp.]|nr:hypothetical protein [Candidatus Dactylopiibacterium sp.]
MKMPSALLCALLFAALGGPVAQAGSASALSLSDSISTAVGSVSDSVSGLGKSAGRAVAFHAGTYRVTEVAEADARVRLTLQPLADADERYHLYVPHAAAAGVAQGDLLAARERPYGLAVYGAEAAAPFVLLLAQAWRAGLDARPVTL